MRFDVYIAGPMSGLPDWNFPAFNEAEKLLIEAGYTVKNPARHGQTNDPGDWEECMRLAITDMLQCSGLALLPGWQDSRGATIEYGLAQKLGIECRSVDNWLENK